MSNVHTISSEPCTGAITSASLPRIAPHNPSEVPKNKVSLAANRISVNNHPTGKISFWLEFEVRSLVRIPPLQPNDSEQIA
jgi:hypothetical protein